MPDALILLVCTGNVCRSPMAAALLQHHLPPDAGWRAASAGTSAVDGEPASASAVAALAEEGVDLDTHRSRPLTLALVQEAQVIVALTRAHRDEILERFPEAARRVYLLASFDPQAGDDKDIPDPILGSLEVYRRCRDRIVAAIPGLVAFLCERRRAG